LEDAWRALIEADPPPAGHHARSVPCAKAGIAAGMIAQRCCFPGDVDLVTIDASL
jgi:hypothetical protein